MATLPASVLLKQEAEYARANHAPRAADRLEWLKDLLDNGTPQQRAALAANDLHQLIDTNGLVEDVKVRVATPILLGVLEGIRNILVLCPLILTWYGISQAVEAYQQLLDNSKQDWFNVPFLYLWQHGFFGYLHGLNLSTLALIDTGLLGALILLTFFIAGRANFYNNLKERKAEELRAHLAQAVSVVALEVAAVSQQPMNIVIELQNVRKAIEQLVQQQQQNQLQVSQGLTEATDKLQIAAQSFQQTAQTFDTTTQTFVQATSDLQQTSQTLQQANGDLQQAAQQVARSTTGLTDAIQDLTTEEEKIAIAGADIVIGLNAMIAKQDVLLTQENQMVTDQSKVVSGLDALKQEVEHTIRQLRQDMTTLGGKADAVVGQLGAAGTKVDNLVTQIGLLNQEQLGYVTALQQMQQNQEQMFTGLAGLIGSIGNAINQLPNLHNIMQGVWTEANNTVNRMGNLPQVVQNELHSILRAHEFAAGKLVDGSRMLDAASQELKSGVVQMKQNFP